MRRWRAIGMLGLVLAANVSCDRTPTPTPPKAVIDADKAAATQPEARPTTQELLGGTYRKFLLPDMPLSVRVPESWKFSTAASVRLLEGPSPADQAIIQLSHRAPLQDDRAEALITRLKAEADTSSPISRAEVRQSGSMRVLERLSTSRPITNPKLDSRGNPVFDPQGNPVTVTTTPVQWTLLAFIPEGKLWNHYELNVIGLTIENFEADRPLLEKILGSLMHETGAATLPN